MPDGAGGSSLRLGQRIKTLVYVGRLEGWKVGKNGVYLTFSKSLYVEMTTFCWIQRLKRNGYPTI
ncbi:MAG: hypothetical protein BA861_09090 [Desulfobacterales bacterium S3730MH5]|nr:MAG: hypothetical protein BA861_09090 [Desulfobacterales bacterium S3730MH5]